MENDDFLRFIEIDEDMGLDDIYTSDKENLSVLIPIQPVKLKAKREQFDKIVAFLNGETDVEVICYL